MVTKLNNFIPEYKQGKEDFACGPVCICIALDYLLLRDGKLHLDHNLIMRVEDLTMKGRIWSSSGTNYRRMKKTIRKMGFNYREIRGDTKLQSLRESISRNNPVILGCMADIDGDRWRHYIVLTGIDERYLYIRDPYPGKRPARVEIAEFMKNGRPMSWGNNRWGIEVFRTH